MKIIRRFGSRTKIIKSSTTLSRLLGHIERAKKMPAAKLRNISLPAGTETGVLSFWPNYQILKSPVTFSPSSNMFTFME